MRKYDVQPLSSSPEAGIETAKKRLSELSGILVPGTRIGFDSIMEWYLEGTVSQDGKSFVPDSGGPWYWIGACHSITLP